MQSELVITLVSGPATDLTGAVWIGNNFGVMIWKKTGTANTISARASRSTTTGSSPVPIWGPATTNPCGPHHLTVSGTINDCFNGQEIFFFFGRADGSSITTDMGLVQTEFRPPDPLGTGETCGTSEEQWQFDPTVPDTWYCMLQYFGDPNQHGIIKVHYNGLHNAQTPGTVLLDCFLHGNVQPCLDITIMSPPGGGEIEQTGPQFNPDYAASGFSIVNVVQGGVSADGDMMVWVNQFGSNSPAWVFMYALGDRTPTGTNANSMHIRATFSTYRKPPATWCAMHNTEDRPDGGCRAGLKQPGVRGWVPGNYNMTMTSATLSHYCGRCRWLKYLPG